MVDDDKMMNGFLQNY